jgi:hypothetical protein
VEKLISKYLYIKIKTMSKEMRKQIDDFKTFNKKKLNENTDEYYKTESNDINSVIMKWYERTGNSFFTEFIEIYPTNYDFNKSLIDNYLINDVDDDELSDDELSDDYILDNYWNAESEIYMLEQEFSNFPGSDLWVEFFNDLVDAGW